MRLTQIDINFDVKYEGHQNCSNILSIYILRLFDDHDMWCQNWCQYLWTTLCQLIFCGPLPVCFYFWHLTSFWQLDIFWYFYCCIYNMGECNNFTFVCPSIHSGVPTLAGGTYPGFGGTYLGKVPTLAWGMYLHW